MLSLPRVAISIALGDSSCRYVLVRAGSLGYGQAFEQHGPGAVRPGDDLEHRQEFRVDWPAVRLDGSHIPPADGDLAVIGDCGGRLGVSRGRRDTTAENDGFSGRPSRPRWPWRPPLEGRPVAASTGSSAAPWRPLKSPTVDSSSGTIRATERCMPRDLRMKAPIALGFGPRFPEAPIR